MFADAAGRPHSLALRPAQDAYRSMPGTPLGIDPRGTHSMDLAAAMNHARMGLEGGGDYFLGAPKFPPGTMRPRSPMPSLPGHDWTRDADYANRGSSNMVPFGYQERDRERELEDLVRKYVTVLVPILRFCICLTV